VYYGMSEGGGTVQADLEPEFPGKRIDVSVLERAADVANITLHCVGLSPSPDQKAEILTAIEELETLLHKADQGISRIEAMHQNEVEGAKLENAENEPNHPVTDFPRLEALKADISTQLAISRALLAPIHFLPPELLSEIFACLLVYPGTWHLEWMDTHFAREDFARDMKGREAPTPLRAQTSAKQSMSN
ncbi:hypothetical protein K523DRAFT_332159, partial [Schizophyllum commune Tattone D]